MQILRHRHDLMHLLPKFMHTDNDAPALFAMYMDTNNHKFYVYGVNTVTREVGVFVYDYRLLASNRIFRDIKTELKLNIEV